MRPDIYLLLILAVFTSPSNGILPPPRPSLQGNSSSSSLQQCIFHTVTYNISQTWYPLLLPYGYFSCIKCVCELFNGRAKVNCKKKPCNKAKCSNAHIVGGNCCKKCPVKNGQAPQPSASCTYLGKTHKHGTVWEIANDKNDALCTECSCSDGFNSCAIRVCPKPMCSNPTKIPGSCCKQCPGNTSKLSTRAYSKGCNSLGRHYQDGEKWHPLVSSYKCIICRCKNSTTHCTKVSCKGNCDKRCCKKCEVPTTVAPTTGPTTSLPQKQVNYPHCYKAGHHKHNTTWQPTIAGITLSCIVCQCWYSSVNCSRVICPKKYFCSKPVVVQGMCCKQCKGQAPTKIKLSPLGVKQRRCGSTWKVYEYTPGTPSTPKFITNKNKDINAHFILESTFKNSIELHTFRANTTHKDVRVKPMLKADLDGWKQLSSPTMKLTEIGFIKDARKRKIEAKGRRKCVTNCVAIIKSVIQMVRFRSRWCRSPPVSLTVLEDGS